jgi:hypothetical protein
MMRLFPAAAETGQVFLAFPPEHLLDNSVTRVPKSTKIHLLTFGGGADNYRLAAVRLAASASECGWFDEIYALTDTQRHFAIEELHRKHGDFIDANLSVFGYWIWKPFLVRHFLDHINEGDILFYIDSGCELSALGAARFDGFIALIERYQALFFNTPAEEITRTKRSVFDDLGGEHCELTKQVQATWFGLKNTARVRGLVDDWLTLSSHNSYKYLDDSASKLEEYPGFVAHRSDQSILSLLVKREGFFVKPHEDVFRAYLYCKNSWVLLEPIHVMRNRGGNSLLASIVLSSSLARCQSDCIEARTSSLYAFKLALRYLHWLLRRTINKLKKMQRQATKQR